MIEIISNTTYWISLLSLYIGMAIFFTGRAKRQDVKIMSLGFIVIVITLVITWSNSNWWTPILIYIFAFLTHMTVPYYIGYLYWKMKYHPKLLTLWRFGGLINDQYLKNTTLPVQVPSILDKAEKEGLATLEQLEDYTIDLFRSRSKYVFDEVFSSLEMFKYYISMREKLGREDALLQIERELGVSPMSNEDFQNYMEDFSNRHRLN